MASGEIYPSAETLERIGWAGSRLADALGARRGRRDLAAVFQADAALWKLVAEVEPADPFDGVPHAEKLRKQEAMHARALGLKPQPARPRTAKTVRGWPKNVNEAFARLRSQVVRIHQAVLAFDPDDPEKQWSWPGLHDVRSLAGSAYVLLSAGSKAKAAALERSQPEPEKAQAGGDPPKVTKVEAADDTSPDKLAGQAGAAPGPGELNSAPAQGAIASGATREEVLRGIKPACQKAYLSYEYAESKAGKRLEDREAYELLEEEGIPTDKGNSGELTDYELPDFPTWSRYLRTARNALDEQKYTPRAGRKTGRSITSGRKLDRQKERD